MHQQAGSISRGFVTWWSEDFVVARSREEVLLESPDSRTKDAYTEYAYSEYVGIRDVCIRPFVP